jgi:hypothetical protein
MPYNIINWISKFYLNTKLMLNFKLFFIMQNSLRIILQVSQTSHEIFCAPDQSKMSH